MKLKVALVAVVFLVVSCGKFGHWYVQWPAQLAGVANFSEIQKSAVFEAVAELNSRTETTLLSTDNSEASSRVFITWVEAIARGATTIAGRATVEEDRCTIEITDLVAQSNEYLKPVLWHEIGHCAGLQHVTEEGEIMFKEAAPLSAFSVDALDRFFSNLLTATGIPGPIPTEHKQDGIRGIVFHHGEGSTVCQIEVLHQ